MQRRASTTPGRANACVGHASRQRVHFPHSSPTFSPATLSGGSSFFRIGGSLTNSIRVRIAARNSQFPCCREISIAFFPINPSPARAAQTAFKHRTCIHIVTIVALGRPKDRFDHPSRLHQPRSDRVVIILMQRISRPNRPAFTVAGWIALPRIHRHSSRRAKSLTERPPGLALDPAASLRFAPSMPFRHACRHQASRSVALRFERRSR